MFLPDPADGVRYLVPPELLVRLPHRRDLVTPALFRDLHNFGDADHDDEARLFRLCMSAVTARLDAAGPDIPNIRSTTS